MQKAIEDAKTLVTKDAYYVLEDDYSFNVQVHPFLGCLNSNLSKKHEDVDRIPIMVSNLFNIKLNCQKIHFLQDFFDPKLAIPRILVPLRPRLDKLICVKTPRAASRQGSLSIKFAYMASQESKLSFVFIFVFLLQLCCCVVQVYCFDNYKHVRIAQEYDRCNFPVFFVGRSWVGTCKHAFTCAI